MLLDARARAPHRPLSDSGSPPMTTNLLAIETAFDRCSVALSRSGSVQAVEHPASRVHAEQLAPMIASLLSASEIDPEAIDVVALSEGPGSYTGLRIGASTAKGLCFGNGASLVAVPTLEALAYTAFGSAVDERDVVDPGVVVVAVRARASDIWWTAYRASRTQSGISLTLVENDSGSTVALSPVAEAAFAVAPLDAHQIYLTGNASAALADSIRSIATVETERIAPLDSETALSSRPPLAHAVAVLGAQRFLAGETVPYADFEPAYLKQPVARIPKRSIFPDLQN